MTYQRPVVSGPDSVSDTLGRCKSGRCRDRAPAFYWNKAWMRLSDATCPRCHVHLSQTTRDYRGGFVRLSPGEVTENLDRALVAVAARIRADEERIAEWEADTAASPDRREFALGLARRQLSHDEAARRALAARQRSAQKAAAAEIASFASQT